MVYTKTYIFLYFTHNIWSYLIWSPVITTTGYYRTHNGTAAAAAAGSVKSSPRAEFSLCCFFSRTRPPLQTCKNSEMLSSADASSAAATGAGGVVLCMQAANCAQTKNVDGCFASLSLFPCSCCCCCCCCCYSSILLVYV